jgi:hypothetical protein
MTQITVNRSLQVLGLAGVLSLGLAVPPSLADHAAKGAATRADRSDHTISQGVPGRRISGGTRSPELQSVQDALIALVPENNLAITTAEHPRLLFYVPQSDAPLAVEFVLRNQADELVYEKTFQVDGAAGLVSVSLSEGDYVPALNENYQWYFSIVAADRAQDISVDGRMRRVALTDWIQQQGLSPDFASQLAEATPIERARLLQAAHLWQDAALVLDELHRAHPEDQSIAAEWAQLLQQVGLTPQIPKTLVGSAGAAPTKLSLLVPLGR